MAKIYAALIEKGLKNFSDVPDKYAREVLDILGWAKV